MPIGKAIILKSLLGSTVLGVAVTGYIYKDEISEYLHLYSVDDQILTRDEWKWTGVIETTKVTGTNPSVKVKVTYKATWDNNPEKTWSCAIQGTWNNSSNDYTDGGIKSQVNGDFKDKTGLPEVRESTDSQTPIKREKDNEKQSGFEIFAKKCIGKELAGITTTSSSSTIIKEIEKQGSEFKFKDFETLYRN